MGDVPGLQNSGAMWAEEFTGFLLDFTQSITDRRLLHLTDEDGLGLIAGTSVDDGKALVQSEFNAAEFSKAWEERYCDPPDVGATARDFLGLKYTRGRSAITISCRKAPGDLAEKLSGLGPALGPGRNEHHRRCRRAPAVGWSPAPVPTTSCYQTRHFPGHAGSWDSRGGSFVVLGLTPCRHSSRSIGG